MIRSKHNNLLNYFIHDKRDLSPAYVRSCEKFLKEISAKHQAREDIIYEENERLLDRSSKLQAPSSKLQAPSSKRQAPSDKRHEKTQL